MKKLRIGLKIVIMSVFISTLICACADNNVNVSVENIIVGNEEVHIQESDAQEVQPQKEAVQAEVKKKDSELVVHFIDIGQGDATLIICGESAMLIDSGDSGKGTFLQNYLQKQGITKLDYLILTHPDADHIGAAPVIITKFEIDTVFMSNYTKDNMTYRKLIQALDDKRLNYSVPVPGEEYSLGNAVFRIAAPNGNYSNPNDASVALVLTHGENSFLFTGDAEETAENDILASGIDVRADVYQAGHHGSRTSSGQEFLDAVSPEYAVISCASDNEYGHPHAQTLNRFRAMGIQLFRTDEQGSLVATSDGKTIVWNAPPSDSWKAGEPTGNSRQESGGLQEIRAAEDGADVISNETESDKQEQALLTYILNIKTKKFHRPECGSLPTTNRSDSSLSRDEIVSQGYEPCKKCNP